MMFPRSFSLLGLAVFCLTISLFSSTALAGEDWKPIDPADLASKTPVVEKDADAEAQGTKKPAVAGEPGAEEEEVEIDEPLDDATFIEEQEEEDADVTDIIGGDIETEEET